MTDMALPAEEIEEPAPARPQARAWEPGDYWAAAPMAELGALVRRRVLGYYAEVEAQGLLSMWRRAHAQYYGLGDGHSYATAAAVAFGGEQGERVAVDINHFGSVLDLDHTLITSVRPAARAQATNSTYGATEETLLAEQILEHDLHHKYLEESLKRVAMLARQYGEGTLVQTWDPTRGQPYGTDPETGRVVHEGDVLDLACGPLDIIRDHTQPMSETRERDWVIVRRAVNRFELAHQYQEHEETILALPSVADGGDDAVQIAPHTERGDASASSCKSDEVFVFELYHRPTVLMPEGRFALCVASTALLVAPLPYGSLPAHTMPSQVRDGSAFGHSSAWNCLSPQQLYNATVSAAVTNHDALAVQNIHLPPGGALDVDILGGLNLIRTEAEPKPLQLLQINEATFKLADLHRGDIEALSATSNVTRGDPGTEAASGAKVAFIDAMSVRARSGEQANYARLQERVFTARLDIYKRFVRTKRLVEIAGEDKSATVKEWTGDSLQRIARVTVSIGNPAMATVQERTALADKYVEYGWVTTPEQYTMVVATGRFDPIEKRDRNEMRLIALENAALRRGEGVAQDPATGAPTPDKASAVPVLKYHRHLLHLREHSSELSSPEAFDDPRFRTALAAHCAWHEEERARMVIEEPWLLEAMGEPPLESELAAMAPPPMPGGPPEALPPSGPDTAPPSDEPVQVAGVDGSMGGPSPAEMPRLPMMPDGSGRADPMATGGGGIT